MKKDVKTRIWGALETLAFCGIYYTAAYIGRFILYLIYAVYFAVSNYINHEIFSGARFMEEINRAMASSRVELIILSDVLMVIFCAIIIYARGGKFKRYMGLEPPHILQIIGGLLTGAAIWYLSINVLSDLLAGTQAIENYGQHMGKLTQANPYVTFALTVIIAPITEEFMFRGALFSSLTRFLNKPMAIIVSSLLFAIAHVDPVQMAYAFVLGTMLSFIRAETGRLYPCMALHFAFNLMNSFDVGYLAPFWVVILVCGAGYAMTLYKKA